MKHSPACCCLREAFTGWLRAGVACTGHLSHNIQIFLYLLSGSGSGHMDFQGLEGVEAAVDEDAHFL